VINLGIKVSPEALISAYFEHRPDAIGLSGLLVKSTQQMVATASDFRAAGIRVPLLVGGRLCRRGSPGPKSPPPMAKSCTTPRTP